MLWVTVPNHADWLYKTGEKVTVEVQFYKYGIPRDNVTVTYEIGGDMMPVADTKGSITLKNGRGGDSCGHNERAGIPRLPPESNRRWKDLFTSYQSRISPEKLRPYTTMPSDFKEFWEKAKAEQKEFPLTYTKEHVEKIFH